MSIKNFFFAMMVCTALTSRADHEYFVSLPFSAMSYFNAASKTSLMLGAGGAFDTVLWRHDDFLFGPGGKLQGFWPLKTGTKAVAVSPVMLSAEARLWVLYNFERGGFRFNPFLRLNVEVGAVIMLKRTTPQSEKFDFGALVMAGPALGLLYSIYNWGFLVDFGLKFGSWPFKQEASLGIVYRF